MPAEGYHPRVFDRWVGSQFHQHHAVRARSRVPEYPPSFPPTRHDPASPSLHRVPWDEFPGFSGSTRGSDSRATTPPRFVFLHLAVLRTSQGSTMRRVDRVSWVPGGPPCTRALLSDPGGSATPGHCGAVPSPGPLAETRLPRAWLLSGLHHTAHMLAVYASQGGLSLHHARLASGRWPGVTGRGWLPAGSQLKVSITSSCVPPSPSCPAHARLSSSA